MQKVCSLVLVSTLVQGSFALAASYQKTNGTIIDPILDTASSTHPYNGPDLEPDLWLDCCEDLIAANLSGADLSGADLRDARAGDLKLRHRSARTACVPAASLWWLAYRVQG